MISRSYRRLIALSGVAVALLAACPEPFGPFENPADPQSDNYLGFDVVESADDIETQTATEDDAAGTVTFVSTVVHEATDYHIQIATNDTFNAGAVVYEDASLGADGNSVALDVTSFENGTLFWRMRAEVDGRFGEWSAAAQFELTIGIVPPDADYEELALGTPRSATVAAGRVDVKYQFTTSVAGDYVISITGFSGGSDFDWVLFETFTDAEAFIDRTADNGIDSGTSISTIEEISTAESLAAATTYYLVVYDFEDLGGDYTIEVTEPTADGTTGDGGITIDPDVPQDFAVALSGTTATLSPGGTMTVTAAPDAGVTADSYAWYVDTTLLGQTGETITFGSDLDAGSYTLTVVVVAGDRVSSAVHRFEVTATDVIDPSSLTGRIVFASDADGDNEIYSINPDGTGLTQLTDNSVSDVTPRLSPDGTRIAFARDVSGTGREIFVMDVDGSNETRLTNNFFDELWPTWSPDGTQIAYQRDQNIYRMNADGSGVQALTSSGLGNRHPDWSPDGTRIAFTSEADGDREIYLLTISTGVGVNLTNSSTSSETIPRWSPDGSRILFTSDRDGNAEIYVSNADGTSLQRLTDDPAEDQIGDFSPDGEVIVFQSDRSAAGTTTGFLMTAAGADQTELSSERLGAPDWGVVPDAPAEGALPDTGLITFASDRDGDMEIFVMEPDGSNQQQLTSNSSYDDMPYFAPDGTRIVFYREPVEFDLFLIDPDGSNEARLTNRLFRADNPAWSPDGTKVAFRSFPLNGTNQENIVVIDADGSNEVQLTSTGLDAAPDWSPDSSRIVFHSRRDGDDEVFVMNADGSAQTNLTNNTAQDAGATWSPDGSRILFSSDRDGDFDLYVMDPDGSNVVQLTDSPGRDSLPTWSPDGAFIAFVSDRDGDAEIYVMSATGGSATQLTFNDAAETSPEWGTENAGANEVTAVSTARLVGQDTTAGDGFGAVDADGDYLVVGAARSDSTTLGKAYVFRRTGTNAWDAGVSLLPNGAAGGGFFGLSVAIDGDYAVVGDYITNSGRGEAWVFRRTGLNTWDNGVRLTAPDAAGNDQFGVSVAVSGDYVVVGAHLDDDNGLESGAGWVFRRTGTNTWDGGTKLVAPDGAAADRFGRYVAIDGDYLLIGATSATGSTPGAAYAFRRTGTNSWDAGVRFVPQVLQNGDAAGVVAIDGEYAVVGAFGRDTQGDSSGSAFVYRRGGINSWDSGTEIVAPAGAAQDEFGISVAIDGDRIAVGARRDDAQGTDSGAVYVYGRAGTNTWNSIGEFRLADGSGGELYGGSVALSGSYLFGGAGSAANGGLVDAVLFE